ncbi:MAG: T9SS type A sorting domain-containing protein [Chitinivibrionia bacterium]|nr:T9SS type A sorting domain-containing protein [Chitinivibrionia bacterium]
MRDQTLSVFGIMAPAKFRPSGPGQQALRNSSIRIFPFILSLLVISLGAAATVNAEWDENGNLATISNDHRTEPRILLADDGNLIVVWQDKRAGNFDIYANKIDVHGNRLWGSAGVAICTDVSSIQRNAKLVSDGDGGAIIAWEDYRQNMSIYAQRVDSDGTVRWTADGVGICTNGAVQEAPSLTPDGSGGAIIAWHDLRAGSMEHDIYAQRVNAYGTVQWTADGVVVCNTSGMQFGPQVATDDNGGAFITWDDYSLGAPQIFAQRMNSSGVGQWAANGIQIASSAFSQFDQVIVPDELGGAIVAFSEYAASNYDLYACKISSAGGTVWLHSICAASGDQQYPEIASDGYAGAVIAWSDNRNSDGWNNIYAQRVDYAGSTKWTANGVSVCAAIGAQTSPRIAEDGSGGAFIAWTDGRVLKTDVYAQKLDASGVPKWQSDGVAAGATDRQQEKPAIAPDGQGGAVAVWQDFRDGAFYDVYAQRVERNGYWGYPSPSISDVRDIPGDEGGLVNLAWDASRLDPWPNESITEYSIWRAISHAEAAAMAARGIPLVAGGASMPCALQEPLTRIETVGSQTFYWKFVTTAPAYYLESYAEDVPTAFDSTAVSPEDHYFQVIAHTSTPTIFWVSEPDSGYSVDNLAPTAPAMLMGLQSIAPEGLELIWNANAAPDIGGYRVYRGTSEDFVPGPGNLIASPADTTAFDDEWRWDGGYYYKASAVDVHGNESGYAVLVPAEVTGITASGAPPATHLMQNYPNPFKPSTTISFGLNETGNAALEIYDVSGRLVRVLVDRMLDAGNHRETWDGRDASGGKAASGVYFYRLKTERFEKTRKMILLR